MIGAVLGRKRVVRLHMNDKGESIEGVMVGRRPVAGHYVIQRSRLLQDEDKTLSLDGYVEVPKANVFFLQVLA